MATIAHKSGAGALAHKIVLVAACALVDTDGRVLIAQRPQGKPMAGLWEFPGGKVEKGESPEAAIVREIDEELGIALDESNLRPLSFASGPANPPTSFDPLIILLFACSKWRGEPECRDGEEIRWYLPEQLAGLEMPPLDRPLAEALLAAIRGGSF